MIQSVNELSLPCVIDGDDGLVDETDLHLAQVDRNCHTKTKQDL